MPAWSPSWKGIRKVGGVGSPESTERGSTEGWPGDSSFGLNRTGDLVISLEVFGIVYTVVTRRSSWEKTWRSSFVRFKGEQRKPLRQWTGCYLGNSDTGGFAWLYYMDSISMVCFIFQAGMLSLVQCQEEIWDQIWFLWLVSMWFNMETHYFFCSRDGGREELRQRYLLVLDLTYKSLTWM